MRKRAKSNGIAKTDRARIWEVLKHLQRLRIVRELFSDAADDES